MVVISEGLENGPLSLSLSPSEGERVTYRRVKEFRGSKREQSLRGILSSGEGIAVGRLRIFTGQRPNSGAAADCPLAGERPSPTY